MKTWEMMKALQENESKEFKSDNCGGTLIAKIDCGLFCTHNNGGYAQSVFDINRKWEEVKQPVTWQEALEANSKGKRVKVETNSNRCKGYTKTFANDDLLQDTEWDAMTALEITTGTWYILD